MLTARMSFLRLVTLATTTASLLLSAPAQAETSSWYSVAAGASVIDQPSTRDPVASGLMEVDLGVGLPPTGPVVFGGVMHVGAHFAVGVDLGGAFRITTVGYSYGAWGLGLDLGAQYRVATDAGASGYARALLGGPFGLVLALGGSYGEQNVGTLGLTLGIDFARLTVHRRYALAGYPSPLRTELPVSSSVDTAPVQRSAPADSAEAQLAPRL